MDELQVEGKGHNHEHILHHHHRHHKAAEGSLAVHLLQHCNLISREWGYGTELSDGNSDSIHGAPLTSDVKVGWRLGEMCSDGDSHVHKVPDFFYINRCQGSMLL